MSDEATAAAVAPWLPLFLCKTDAGRREISERLLPLSRPARNLLLIIDTQRTAGEWLGLVRGCGPAELQQLLDAGLVGRLVLTSTMPPGAAPDADAAPVAVAAPVTARMSLADALAGQPYQRLYDRLTAEARQQLGLLKGYALILAVERCNGPAELRMLALQFVEQVRAAKGDEPARALAQRLVEPG